MVILRFDTVIADAAMVRARRPPDVAALAVFGWNLHGGIGACCGHDHGPFSSGGAQVQWVFIRITRGKGM